MGYRTAKEFSDKHNIPQSTYAMHESSKRGLKPDVAKKYAELLNISLSWLLTGEGFMVGSAPPLSGHAQVGGAPMIMHVPDIKALGVDDCLFEELLSGLIQDEKEEEIEPDIKSVAIRAFRLWQDIAAAHDTTEGKRGGIRQACLQHRRRLRDCR